MPREPAGVAAGASRDGRVSGIDAAACQPSRAAGGGSGGRSIRATSRACVSAERFAGGALPAVKIPVTPNSEDAFGGQISHDAQHDSRVVDREFLPQRLGPPADRSMLRPWAEEGHDA